jgi:hypothetical protein
MSGTRQRTRRALFALATAAALGFGAQQAFAAPGAAADARACTNAQCDADCKARGYGGGICAGSWGCACWIQ